MRITSVEPYCMWAGHRNFMFVVVETEEGRYGIGEAGLTGRERAVIGAIEHLRPLLVGQDAMRSEHLWQVMYRGGFFPAQGAVAAAIAAIDIALWDLKGKALGVPVYQLLGGLVREKVVCYPHVPANNDCTILAESCRKRVAEGWKFVRCSVPCDGDLIEPRRAVRQAIEQLHAIREAVGEQIEIIIDVHTRLELPEAVWLCREIEPLRPYFVEDPLRSENITAYRTLRQRTGVPLAAGEQFTSKWQFQTLIEEELIDYCRVDLCLAGGFTETRKIAGWCETHGVQMAVHNPLGAVSSAACLHFNLACPNFGVQEQPGNPGAGMQDLLPREIEWSEGYVLPPKGVGLGVGFDREAAKGYPARLCEPPHLRRGDGAFTNW